MEKISQVAKSFFIILIKLYQYTISPALGPRCRFSPSCSEYAIEVIKKFGVFQGAWLIIKRLMKCHPGHPGGYDPIPEGSENK